MQISNEAYGMLIRALKHYGYDADEVKKDYLENRIQGMRIKNDETINVSGLTEKEYEMLAYRYGFFDGRIKLFIQTAKAFSTTVDYVQRTEEQTIMKIIKALKNKKGKKKN